MAGIVVNGVASVDTPRRPIFTPAFSMISVAGMFGHWMREPDSASAMFAVTAVAGIFLADARPLEAAVNVATSNVSPLHEIWFDVKARDVNGSTGAYRWTDKARRYQRGQFTRDDSQLFSKGVVTPGGAETS